MFPTLRTPLRPSSSIGHAFRTPPGVVSCFLHSALRFGLALPLAMHSAFRRRLLLCDTVNRPEAPDQISTGDADHLMRWKQSLQGGERLLVVGMGVGRDQDDAVSDVEVRVA